MSNWIRTAALLCLCFACQTKQNAKIVVYNGPLKQATSIVMHYTEKEKLKTILLAKKYNEFINGDREFPEGIYLEFYNESGAMTSTLRANTAFYFKAESKWRGRGNVEVVNIAKNQQLNTEELFWFPQTKKIKTEKFVTVRDQEDVIYGTGLKANEDLSDYSIKNTSGDLQTPDE